MGRNFRYSIAAGFFPTVFFILIIAWLFSSSRSDFFAASNLLVRNQKVSAELNLLESLMFEVDSATRGFLISKDEKFFDFYQKAAKEIPSSFLRLRSVASSNLVDASRINVLERMWQRQSLDVVRDIENRRHGVERSPLLLKYEAQHWLEGERGIVAEIHSDQDRYISEQSKRLEDRQKFMTLPFWLFVSLDIALLLTTWYFIVDSMRRREKAEYLRIENARTLERSNVLERSNRELEQFAYVASHDLQEPLRKIQAFGDRLHSRFGESLPEDGRDYLQRILHAARRMQSLIDGLLTLSRVNSQHRAFESVALGPLVQEVLGDLELLVERAGAHVEINSLPTVQGDPLLMRQLFQNLIANALKFRREGVESRVRVYSEILSDGESCRIFVEDNGIGFEEKHAQKIFQAFHRLHGAGQYEGTGIGLAVCKKIIDRHNGEIEARGMLGEGARFIVTLPFAQVSERKETKGE